MASENQKTISTLPVDYIHNIRWFEQNKIDLFEKYRDKIGKFCMISNEKIEFCLEEEVQDEPAALVFFR